MNPTPPPGPCPAVVLSCAGAPHGDLNIVRSLGDEGVPVVVVGEDAQAPVRHSRHVRRFIHLPGFSTEPARLGETLDALCREHGRALPVIPSADPDLAALCALQARGPVPWRAPVAAPALVRALTDKAAFEALAREAGLPVPRGRSPATAAEVEATVAALTFPLIVKPARPRAWAADGVPADLARTRAVVVETPRALRDLCRALAPSGVPPIVQEYVPGTDDAHHDVHAFVDREDRVTTYCGRKWHLHPPQVGTGCLVETVHEPELEALAADVLRRIGFRGIANMNFKRHAVTGAWLLLEINPRVSHWNILASRAGVNLPWLAWRDLTGAGPVALPPRRVGLWYRHTGQLLRSLRADLAAGRIGWSGVLGAWLRGPVVHQVADRADPGPMREALRALGARAWRRLRR